MAVQGKERHNKPVNACAWSCSTRFTALLECCKSCLWCPQVLPIYHFHPIKENYHTFRGPSILITMKLPFMGSCAPGNIERKKTTRCTPQLLVFIKLLPFMGSCVPGDIEQRKLQVANNSCYNVHSYNVLISPSCYLEINNKSFIYTRPARLSYCTAGSVIYTCPVVFGI